MKTLSVKQVSAVITKKQAGTMRFFLYNIRYGTGSGIRFHLPFPFSGYLKRTQKNTRWIIEFIKQIKPDIIGLIEVDSGSFRTKWSNQAELVANALGHFYVYQSKYDTESLVSKLPVLNKQGNAFLTSEHIKAKKFHYFQKGIKRLVIELEFDKFCIFLVHLSIKFRHRHYQLSDLHSLINEAKKPVIVAGDLNALWGDHELNLFLAATGLKNANTQSVPSYPSRDPRLELDFILHSPQIKITNFFMPKINLSDHMPLVCDFEIENP